MPKNTVTIKRPLYGAPKIFNWTLKEAGWGIAVSKLDTDNPVTVIKLKDQQYKVPTLELIATLKQWKSFNNNGGYTCGYLPQSVIEQIARTSQEAQKREVIH